MKSKMAFHPEKISRRGERITWALALISLVALVILWTRIGYISIWNLVFVGLIVVSAASISLGNWMDRKTVLTLSPEGLEYRNGLRGATLKWDDVQAVRVTPSRWGDQVHVVGTDAHFQFRTMSEIIHKGEIRNRMGFAQGKLILEQIMVNSGLEEIDRSENARYYSRP